MVKNQVLIKLITAKNQSIAINRFASVSFYTNDQSVKNETAVNQKVINRLNECLELVKTVC